MNTEKEYIEGLDKHKNLTPFSESDKNIEKLFENVFNLEPKTKFLVEDKVEESEPITNSDELYCKLIATHLAKNYVNTGIWCSGPSNRPWMNRKDEKAMEEGYKSAVKFVVDRYEDALWLEVKQFFKLAKVSTKQGQRKPSWSRVKDILTYKTIGKTKRSVRKYLYS